MPEKKGQTEEDVGTLVDRYAELREMRDRLNARIEGTELPFLEDIRDIQDRMKNETATLLEEQGKVTREIIAIESRLKRSCDNTQETCFFSGNTAQVHMKRSFTRSVDGERLHELLDKEGLLSHYGYIFKHRVNVKDLEAAMKAPVFPREAEDCISAKERTVKFEVV